MRKAILLLPLYAIMAWCSGKHKYNFTFTFSNVSQTFVILGSSITTYTYNRSN